MWLFCFENGISLKPSTIDLTLDARSGESWDARNEYSLAGAPPDGKKFAYRPH